MHRLPYAERRLAKSFLILFWIYCYTVVADPISNAIFLKICSLKFKTSLAVLLLHFLLTNLIIDNIIDN